MTNYQTRKEEARQKAMEFQYNFYLYNYSYDELFTQQIKFDKLATRYGLRKEFKANGII